MAKNLVNNYEECDEYTQVEKIKCKSKNLAPKKKIKVNKHKSTDIDWSKFDEDAE